MSPNRPNRPIRPWPLNRKSHTFGWLFLLQICPEGAETSLLFEKLVERIDPAIDLDAESLALVVEYRNISHGPLDSTLVEIDHVAIFVVKHLLGKVNGDIGLGGQNVNLDFTIDELADHLFGRRELAATGRGSEFDLETVVPISFG